MTANTFTESENSDLKSQAFKAGRLINHIHVWAQMQAPESILKMIRGYRLPLVQKVPLCWPSIDHKYQTNSSPQMRVAIKELIKIGVLEPVLPSRSFISPMFLVPKSDGTMRPIFNLRNLNNYLITSKFRLINVQKVPNFLQPHDWLVKIDLSNAYFHLRVAESHRRYLRIIYNKKLYQMTCLPFGLATAPKVFATLSNWVSQKLREKGLRVIVYLDDYLIVHQNRHVLSKQALETVNFLQNLGWQINYKKSVLKPQRSLDFLGITWDPWLGIKSLPQIKCMNLRDKIFSVLSRKTVRLKEIQSLIGLINFASFVVPRGRLNHRDLIKFSLSLPENDSFHRYPVPEEGIKELRWWLKNYNRPSVIHQPPVQHFLVTDASDLAWGACLDNLKLAGSWTQHERHLHSNQKEMLAVLHVLEDQGPYLRGSAVMLQCDNKTTIAYIRKEGGSKSTSMMKITRQVFSLLDRYNIHLTAHHIPGKFNGEADHLSRARINPEWHLLQEVTEIIFQKWGVPYVDLMASKTAHVVPRYVSLDLLDQNVLFHDAFSRMWDFPLAWIFPPPYLIPKVLTHLNSAKGIYLLVVPKWEKVFWKPDIRNRALCPPFTIHRLHRVLVDTVTGLPPQKVNEMTLQVWKCGGGPQR